MITTTDLTLRYPGSAPTVPPVLGPVSITLPSGTDAATSTTVTGLVGRNGAGKSTMLALLAGQLRPSGGSVQVNGQEAFDDDEVLRTVSLTGVDVGYPSAWAVDGVLAVAARRFPGWDATTADRLLAGFGISADTGYGDLSRGQRSAVGIVIGLASNAPVTLLDEPYVGLDAQARHLLARELLALEEPPENAPTPRTIVLATHHLADLEQVASRVLVLDHGRITHDLDPAELGERFLRVTGSTERVTAALAGLRRAGGEILERRDMAGATRVVIDLGAGRTGDPALADVTVEPLGIEDAVVQLTGGDL